MDQFNFISSTTVYTIFIDILQYIQKNPQILRPQLDKLSLSEDTHIFSCQTEKEN